MNPTEKNTYSWAIQEKKGSEVVRTLAFRLWSTPEQAIEEYTKMTGKSWEQLQREGAKLVKQCVVIRPKPDQSNTSW